MKKYYLTTPLYYVNAKPHIGHSYTTVAADVLARFKRMAGYQVLFLTGTDEHGQKVQKASLDAGLTPQEFTDRVSATFSDLWKTLNISYDDFIRTTEPRHIHAVTTVWKELNQKGLIYRQKYEGWYCTPCESFWAYKDLGQDGAKKCPQCSRALEEIQEENFFFAISKFQDWLMEHIRKNPKFILPESRRNETYAFLENNRLLDLCVSRPRSRLSWGIDCPLSPDYVTYVWFDALINYVSACGYPDMKPDGFWPADVHLIGKDILRPHTVYWPIMLHALGMEVPRMVFAHGWWVKDKEKMSKSLGNVIDPHDVVAEFGRDAYRYFLLREVSFGQDGTYSDEAITLRYNTDLANDLGNLYYRALTMMDKYFGGKIPVAAAADVNNVLRDRAAGLVNRMEEAMDVMRFQDALVEVWALIGLANKFIEDRAPWKLFKEKRDRELLEVMVSLCETLRIVAQAVSPFMPDTARKMWAQLGLPPEELTSDSFLKVPWNYFAKGGEVKKGEPLFPRRETSVP